MISLKSVVCFLLVASCTQALSEKQYPSLFFTQSDIPALREKVESDTWMKEAFSVLKKNADSYMTVPTDPYPYSGKYNGMGTVGRALGKKAGVLAYTGTMTGDTNYFRKGIDMLVAVAKQADPHDKEVYRGHLQVGDAGRAFSVSYDWLYPYMTDEERTLIRDEIREFGKTLYEYDTCWGAPDPGVSSCNHNAVHHGAIGLCALVLGDEPEWQAKATERIRAYFKYAIDETGYFTEGHSYANYGLLGSLTYSDALKNIGGPDLVSEQPALEWMTEQFCYKMLPDPKEILCLNDNSEDLGNAAMPIYPITRYQQPEALWCWLRIEGKDGWKTYGAGHNGYQGDGLALPFALIWGDPGLKPVDPDSSKKSLSYVAESGRVFARDSWGDSNGSVVSFTSGVDFHRGHNHQDENAFTFYAKGEDFAIDPGYWPKDTRCHNTFLVNGIGQISFSQGRMIEARELGDAVYAKAQAPEAYVWSELLGHYQRQILYGRAEQPYLMIVDELQNEPDAEAEYTWMMNTWRKNDLFVENGNLATLIGANVGGICDIHILAGNGVLAEADLRGKSFSRRGKDIFYGREFKQLNYVTTSKACRQVTLLIARGANETPATITAEGEGLNQTVTIQFANYTDVLTVSKNNIEFSRSDNRR